MTGHRDPARLDPARLHPELRARALRTPRVPVENRVVRGLLRAAVRWMPAVDTPGVAVRDVEAGEAQYRLHVPEAAAPAPRPALLWIHGGGHVIGGPRQCDALCGRLSAELGITVITAAYRLSPEHTFPAPHHDVRAVWDHLIANADALGIDPAHVAVGGSSAGGGLAAGVVQQLVDEGTQPAAQLLVYPMLDDRTAADRSLDAIGHPLWDNRANLFGWRSFLAREPGLPVDPPAYAVPARRSDLRGMPPTWIGVGDVDLFHAEDLAYARRLGEAGVDVTVEEVRGAPHGFDAVSPRAPVSVAFLDAAAAWLGSRLG